MAECQDEQRRLYLEAQAALCNFERVCKEPDAGTDDGRAKIFSTMKLMENACNAFMDYGTLRQTGEKALIE